MARIAFIEIGTMGLPMAQNLIAAEHASRCLGRPRAPVAFGARPLFALDLIVKDLALACVFAEEDGLAPSLAAAALKSYQRTQAAGHGSLDYSAVYVTQG